MYGASRTVGIGPPVTLGGRRLSVRARTIRDYAEIEAYILSLRGNLFDAARLFRWRSLSAELFCRVRSSKDLWGVVTYRDLQRWLGTWEGWLFDFWIAVRRDSGLSYDAVRELVQQELDCLKTTEACWMWRDGVENAIAQANCEDELGALEWLGIESEENHSEGIPWPLVYRVLGEEPFNIPPDSIERMTLRQVHFYWCKRESLKDDIQAESAAGVLDFIQQQKTINDKAADNLTAGRRWDVM